MIKLESFKNKYFLIIGMGITGISVSNSLLKGGANVYFWDDDLDKRSSDLLDSSKFLFLKFTVSEIE